MPIFDVKSPDGRTIEVNAPEGATEAQAIAYAQAHWEELSKGSTVTAPHPEQTAQPVKTLAQAQADAKKVPEQSSMLSDFGSAIGKGLFGVGEAGLSAATGAIATPVAGLAGIASGGDADVVKKVQEAGTYQPRTEGGQEAQQVLGYIPGAIQKGAEQAGGAVSEATGSPLLGAAVATIPTAAAQIAGMKAGIGVGKGAASAAGKGVDAAGNTLAKTLPSISEEKAVLADKAEKMGIKVPLHALSDNKMVRMAGEFIDNLPLSGSTIKSNKIAFNKTMIKQIGGDESADALTPQVFNKAMKDSGEKIGSIMNNISVSADPELISGLKDLKSEMSKHSDETEKVIDGHISSLVNLARKNNGVIPGEAIKNFDSQLGQRIRQETNPATKTQLSDFQEILRDAVGRNIKDEKVSAELKDARTKYAKGKVLEPLVAKNDLSGISPTALIGRLNSTSSGKHRMATGSAGDLGDAAAIAQNFLKEQKTSGTAERGFLMGALTELGGLGKVAGGIAAGNIYNRLSPKVSSSIIKKSLPETAEQSRLRRKKERANKIDKSE